MGYLGVDCGTYNLVTCRRDKEDNFVYKKEINAFIEVPLETDFVFNMMKKAGVPLIERREAKIAYALGEAAINMAYTMNLDLKRPMSHGCLNPKEKHAQQIMSIMIHSLIGDLSDQNETVYYSTPANAINEETDADYHTKVLEAIFKGYEDSKGNKIKPFPINEGLAVIYAELQDKNFTGVGISFGSGMINICFSIFANPAFKFSLVNSGDWIDRQAAKATGESPTFINKEKTKIDFTQQSDSLVDRAIKTQYEIMMQKTVTGIKQGLEQTGSKARTDHPIDIVIAGGTSLPNGFDTMFADVLKKANLPIKLGNVIRPKDPLFSVAKGTLIAAENSI
jgi:actin-like ATPase involved in cell morphogenesis